MSFCTHRAVTLRCDAATTVEPCVTSAARTMACARSRSWGASERARAQRRRPFARRVVIFNDSCSGSGVALGPGAGRSSASSWPVISSSSSEESKRARRFRGAGKGSGRVRVSSGSVMASPASRGLRDTRGRRVLRPHSQRRCTTPTVRSTTARVQSRLDHCPPIGALRAGRA